jgi:polyhydroxyalkanoate synthesis repressor PhaR
MPDPRIIKKYPNRRLYDTKHSRYITLADVLNLVIEHVSFIVIDSNTKKDITRNILLQIITEQESRGTPMFTAEILSKMIRFYGNSMQGMFSSYLGKSLSLFIEQQTHLQKQLQEVMSSSPVGTMADLTKKNLDIWKEMQESYLKTYGLNPASQSKKSPEEN